MCELIEEMEGMIKRKGLCLVMAAAMLGLTACGTDSGSSGDAGANANAAPEDVLKDGNKTELTVVFREVHLHRPVWMKLKPRSTKL